MVTAAGEGVEEGVIDASADGVGGSGPHGGQVQAAFVSVGEAAAVGGEVEEFGGRGQVAAVDEGVDAGPRLDDGRVGGGFVSDAGAELSDGVGGGSNDRCPDGVELGGDDVEVGPVGAGGAFEASR